ncbi:MAG: DUF4197 domain-containing protein [Bacteroidia bacterium]|nr:DUF4197 domain-containing protein [Bacteroidia bacterium]
MKRIPLLPALCCALLLGSCDALYQAAEGVLYGSADPTETEMAGGLKEALANGAANAVLGLSRQGGYSNDPLVRIPFPEEAQFAANTLRDIGMGSLVDNFEGRLNEGAEQAADLALPIFRNAITSMTFADVKNILLGGENAATEYFKSATRDQLVSAFSPVIKGKLDEVHATELWSEITTRYNSIPLVRKKVETDLVKYATGKALDGLFLKVADEERKIREQPIARTSELLKKVFGYADRQKAAGK